MHFQHIYGCHSVLMLAIFANSCSVDPTNWWLFWSGVCAALSSKPSLEIYSSSHPVGASCAVYPRLLANGPRTENQSVPEILSDSRDSSCVSGSSWSGRGIMNPCLASLEAKLIVQASSPFSPSFDGRCTSRPSLGCRWSFGESFVRQKLPWFLVKVLCSRRDLKTEVLRHFMSSWYSCWLSAIEAGPSQ